jgi:hypothetical protein
MEVAKLKDEGFVDLGVQGAESLKGVMGDENTLAFVKESVKELSNNGILGNLDQISQRVKLFQAVGDLFSIPRGMWASVQTLGGWKGEKEFFKSLVGITEKEVSQKEIVDASEFMTTGRKQVGDVDSLKRIQSDIDRDLSLFQKTTQKLDKLTDIAGIKQAKNAVVKSFQALEHWQFEQFMTPLKY